jgi:glycosyltransferase involved in cell wall biosynthesis
MQRDGFQISPESGDARAAASAVPDLSLVVPCYDEAPHLRESVATISEILDGSRLAWEIVFVDDGSRDGTRDILRELCDGSERLRCIFHERNRGRGGAFKTGFAASSGRVTGFLDVDLEVHPLYIPALVAQIDHHGFDVVTGLRIYRLSQTRGLHRHLLSQAYRALCWLLIGFGVRDSETGCKFFRRETAGEVVLGSESDGWFWDTEVMARAALEDLRILEMPVLFLRRPDKKSSVRLLRDSVEYLKALHRFRGQVGLSLLGTSPLYWTGVGYDLAMRLLYGRALSGLYAEVAERIPGGASVVDVCAGTARLEREFLRGRGCRYLGLDWNGHLLMSARRRGAEVRRFDLFEEEVPEADYVVMCASFYHFHERETEILARLRRAARKAVIVSEPVVNWTSGPPAPVARWLRALTKAGVGDHRFRYDAESFRRFAERHGAVEYEHPPGARHALAVFPGGGP